MPLYTRTGDGGFASLPGAAGQARRVRKDDPRLVALGELDELASAVGFCLAEAERAGDASIRDALKPIQDELFRAGSILAAGEEKGAGAFSSAVAAMEERIDAICAELPKLNDFILPGGCELSARLHLARTAARRAERAIVTVLNPPENDSPATVVLTYLNRLSDFLFALARLANHNNGESETIWTH